MPVACCRCARRSCVAPYTPQTSTAVHVVLQTLVGAPLQHEFAKGSRSRMRLDCHCPALQGMLALEEEVPDNAAGAPFWRCPPPSATQRPCKAGSRA